MADEKRPAEEESTTQVDATGESAAATAPVADAAGEEPDRDFGADDEASDEADVVDESAVEADAVDESAVTPRRPLSHVRLALIAGLVGVLALAGLTGWLGYRTYESTKAEEQRNVFLQVGRQGALNLTTIDWQNADADVQRILDSATGAFYDDFQRRAEPFVEVVKQAQSKSVGTVAEAGLESASDSQAQVLVAVNVQTTNAGAPEQQPRAWRMRLTVQDVNGEAKVAKVEFVP